MPLSVPHWSQPRTVLLAESKSGVRVTCDPRDNVVYPAAAAWPPAPLRKKLCGSRWVGATPEDARAPRGASGTYSALQSLNSEDAVTWSVFGSMSFLAEDAQLEVYRRLFDALELPAPASTPRTRFWKRVSHPEKPEATSSGPELDAEIRTDDTLIIVEAKWNSKVDARQGTKRNRDQIGLRVDYCAGLGRAAFPSVTQWVVLGVGRAPDAFGDIAENGPPVRVRTLTWNQVVGWFPSPEKEEILSYFRWRDEHAKRASGGEGPHTQAPDQPR